MIDPYRKSPMLAGGLLFLGGVLMIMSGYFFLDDVADKPNETQMMLILTGLGYVIWIVGSVLLARARFSSLWAGFCCGLLLLPGLFILLTIISTRSRQEIWQEANPNFTNREQKRQYRDLKSLY